MDQSEIMLELARLAPLGVFKAPWQPCSSTVISATVAFPYAFLSSSLSLAQKGKI
jgi:hypothetical protein